MKKSAILVLFAILIMEQAWAFDLQGVRMGVKLSPNISWLRPETRGYDHTAIRVGYSYGLVTDISIGENYFISTGFNIAMMGGTLEYPVLHGTPQREVILSRRFHLQYVEVPLTIKLITQEIGYTSFFGQIGFGAGLRVRAKARDYFPELGNVHFYNDDIAADTRLLRGSLIIGGGIKYSLGGRISLLGGITFNNGFSNVLKGENPAIGRRPSAIQNYLEMTLGVMF